MKNNENVACARVFLKEIIYVMQGCSWCDVLWKNLWLFALCYHFGSQSLVWSVVARFHFSFSAHQCRLQPLGPAFALLVPTRAESCCLCFDGSMRYVATRDQKRHWFLMCLFCQLSSDVWHHVASVVKTKSVLTGFSLNRLNRMK